MVEVATFGGGHTPPMADPDNYEDGYVLWVTSQDVKSNYLDRTTTQITEKGAKELTLYPAGSLVMVTRSGILRHTLPVAELRKPSTVNQDIRVILPQGECCGEWLLQFFISHNKELLLEFGKTGTTVESVDFGKIKDMLLYMPSTVEQQQIGDFFAKLDSLITLHQRKYDKLVIFKKTMLEKMFPKDGESVPEIRFAGFTDPWEQRKLGEVAHFINGRAYSQNELLFSGKYPVLRVGNFYTNDSWYYSDLELEDKNYAYEGDLLYTWSATFGPHIWHGNKVIYHYHIWKVQLEAALEKLFAFQLLERDKERILSDKNGSTMVHITKTGIENTSVLMPCSVEEQRRIGAFFDHLDSIITLHQRKLELLRNIKKSLLDKMFV